jgi:exopolysaccharide biosynthesis predicted pyruvyltransferase EpsI
MLTIGEQNFLRRLGWNNSILECEYVQSNNKVPKCRDHVKEMSKQAKVALWHAGGNWGDLWVDAQWPRIESFEILLLNGFTVVGMPQSLYYKDLAGEKKQTDLIKSRVMKGLNLTELESFESRSVTHSRLIFTWREQSSYEQGKKLYPFATNKLVPDIAFQLGPFTPSRPVKYESMVDIIIFLRDDYESKVKSQRNTQAIQKLLNSVDGGRGLTFKIVDWNDRLTLFKSTNILFDDASVKLLSMGKIVICDRLHAAILAYLSGLPFVYLDQVSNKLTKTLSVALSVKEGCNDEYASMMARSISLQDALKKAVQMLMHSNLI